MGTELKLLDFSPSPNEENKRTTFKQEIEKESAIKLEPNKENMNCALCNGQIEGKFVHALGKTWHPEHFECAKCKIAILETRFNQKDGRPYCEECFSNLFLKKCEYCKEPIKDKIVTAMTKTYHYNHFTCNNCNVILNDAFYEKEGKAYCEECNVKMFAPTCSGCGLPILETSIVALEKKWHQNCFVCYQCSQPVKERTFQVENERPLCAGCATIKI